MVLDYYFLLFYHMDTQSHKRGTCEMSTEEIAKRYIHKSSFKEKPKMERNLQAEIEKLKSIYYSVTLLPYVNDTELDRLICSVDELKFKLESLKNAKSI